MVLERGQNGSCHSSGNPCQKSTISVDSTTGSGKGTHSERVQSNDLWGEWKTDVRVTVNAGGEDYLQLREEKLNLCKDGSDSVNILATRLSRWAKAASALYKYSDPSNQSECVRSTARSKGQEQHRHRM